MTTGTVKWFNTTKGYGFIQPDEAGADVFLHVTTLSKSGIMNGVNEGQKVSYEVVTFNGKTSAANVQLID